MDKKRKAFQAERTAGAKLSKGHSPPPHILGVTKFA